MVQGLQQETEDLAGQNNDLQSTATNFRGLKIRYPQGCEGSTPFSGTLSFCFRDIPAKSAFYKAFEDSVLQGSATNRSKDGCLGAHWIHWIQRRLGFQVMAPTAALDAVIRPL
jgi:hypothetical protein